MCARVCVCVCVSMQVYLILCVSIEPMAMMSGSSGGGGWQSMGRFVYNAGGVMNTGLKLVCIKDAIGGSRSAGLYRFIQAIL